jgi:hypothetical protein
MHENLKAKNSYKPFEKSHELRHQPSPHTSHDKEQFSMTPPPSLSPSLSSTSDSHEILRIIVTISCHVIFSNHIMQYGRLDGSSTRHALLER